MISWIKKFREFVLREFGRASDERVRERKECVRE